MNEAPNPEGGKHGILSVTIDPKHVRGMVVSLPIFITGLRLMIGIFVNAVPRLVFANDCGRGQS